MDSTERLRSLLQRRAGRLDPEIRRRLIESQQVVIFGSFAASLESNKSDLDVFCIGDSRTHFKSPTIELLVLPEHDVYSEVWLGSELANHISAYGVPLGPKPDWFNLTFPSSAAAIRKEKRIDAYLRSLQAHWSSLSAAARTRYEMKIRRELQRLQFIRDGKAVPPTKVLDTSTEAFAQTVGSQLRHISASQLAQMNEMFPDSLAARLTNR